MTRGRATLRGALVRREGVAVVREQEPWLDVPFGEKDQAKAAGAKYDWRARRWYAPRPGMPELARWLPVPRAPDGPSPSPPPDIAATEPAAGAEPAEVRLARELRGLTEPNVLARLTRRRPPWRVLHSVPLGTGRGDVDHVLLGPPGVVTVDTEHHPGRAVRFDGDVLTVDRRSVDHVPRARAEAERAGRLLAAARGAAADAVPVTAALAVIAASVAPAPGGQPPRGVLVTTPASLPRLVTALPAVLDDTEIDELYAVARRLGTWTRDL